MTALAIPLGLAACSSPQGPMTIRSYGPTEIKAGKPFNVQPDGNSAIWTNTTNAPQTSVVVLAGTRLPGPNVQENGTLVSSLVPPNLYAKPGRYPLYILDAKSGKKSNEIYLTVK